jgi:hypothetical protein
MKLTSGRDLEGKLAKGIHRRYLDLGGFGIDMLEICPGGIIKVFIVIS